MAYYGHDHWNNPSSGHYFGGEYDQRPTRVWDEAAFWQEMERKCSRMNEKLEIINDKLDNLMNRKKTRKRVM